MCGRYVISSPPEALRRLFGYSEQPNFPPRFNVAPTQPVPVVIRDHGARHFRLMRWGFMPAWVKDPRGFALVINARCETVLDKPSFRNAIRRRRCLVPADGYYEWQASPARKRPFFIHRRDGAPFAFAGIAETWTGPNGEEVDTLAIITAAARADMAVLHDRVPVTIDPADFERWLDGDALSAADVTALLVAPRQGAFVWHEVSGAVNRVANDRADLIVPLTAEQAAAADEAERGRTTMRKKPQPSVVRPVADEDDSRQGSLF
jgi:putative SOS response-associated peptidase YedK